MLSLAAYRYGCWGLKRRSSCFDQRWSPRGHILKSLALASKPQVLENCPVLGSRTRRVDSRGGPDPPKDMHWGGPNSEGPPQ